MSGTPRRSKIPKICCNGLEDIEIGSAVGAKKSYWRNECNRWPVGRYTKRNFHGTARRLHDRCNIWKSNRRFRQGKGFKLSGRNYPSSQAARHFPFCKWSTPKHSVQWSILSHWAQACGHGRQNWMRFESSEPPSAKEPWGQISKQEPRCMVRFSQWVHWELEEPLHWLQEPWQG